MKYLCLASYRNVHCLESGPNLISIIMHYTTEYIFLFTANYNIHVCVCCVCVCVCVCARARVCVCVCVSRNEGNCNIYVGIAREGNFLPDFDQLLIYPLIYAWKTSSFIVIAISSRI